MLQHDRPPTPVPHRKQDPAMTALVLRVLETGDEVRDAAEAEDETGQRGPRTSAHRGNVSVLFFLCSLTCATRAVGNRMGEVMHGRKEISEGVDVLDCVPCHLFHDG